MAFYAGAPLPNPSAAAATIAQVSADSTRFVRIKGDLRQAIAQILSPVLASQSDLERVTRIAENLYPGDRATLEFFVEAEGELERLEVGIVADMGTYLRVKGRGAPFEVARDALETYWRGSLTAIDGRVNLSVRESRRPRGSPPVLRLGYQTEQEFSCDGYWIDAELSRTADSLQLELLGISEPVGICAGSGPAWGEVDLDLPDGTYRLRVASGTRSDHYQLVLTDSSTQLRAVRGTFTRADERLLIRFPKDSFVLYCQETEVRRAHCGRVRSWLASVDGISVHRFPSRGIVPYREAVDSPGEELYFRYAGPGALEAVRSCFNEVQTAPALAGLRMTVDLWTGEMISTWGPPRPSDPSNESPPAGPVSCLPAVPTPAADSLSLQPAEAEPYLDQPFYAHGYSCSRPRTTPRREVARDVQRSAAGEGGEDAVERGRQPIPLTLPDAWATAPERIIPPTSATLAPKTSQSAVFREQLHADLREWQCRGGKTVGDAEKHAGAAWYWVEHEGDWYYLLPETTAEAVDTYLVLVDTYLAFADGYGTELEWSALDEDDGPERVAVGPDRVVIPGFELYRWRP